MHDVERLCRRVPSRVRWRGAQARGAPAISSTACSSGSELPCLMPRRHQLVSVLAVMYSIAM